MVWVTRAATRSIPWDIAGGTRAWHGCLRAGTSLSCFSSTQTAVSSCAAQPTPGQPSSCVSIGASKPGPNFRLQQAAPLRTPMALFYFLAPNAKQQGDVVSLSTRHLGYKKPSPSAHPYGKPAAATQRLRQRRIVQRACSRPLAPAGAAPAPTPRSRWGSCPAPRPGARWAGGSSGPRAPRARCPGRTP